MTEIYFVRHAHAYYSEDEYHRPLSAQGQRDTERVTNLLKHQRIDAVYASPYRRAIQTVEGIAQARHLPVQTVDGLKERQLSTGMLEDFHAAVLRVWHEPSFAWAGGESNQQATARYSKIAQHPSCSSRGFCRYRYTWQYHGIDDAIF